MNCLPVVLLTAVTCAAGPLIVQVGHARTSPGLVMVVLPSTAALDTMGNGLRKLAPAEKDRCSVWAVVSRQYPSGASSDSTGLADSHPSPPIPANPSE